MKLDDSDPRISNHKYKPLPARNRNDVKSLNLGSQR